MMDDDDDDGDDEDEHDDGGDAEKYVLCASTGDAEGVTHCITNYCDMHLVFMPKACLPPHW